MNKRGADEQSYVLTREEMTALLEDRCQRALGIPLDEFEQRYRAGEWDSCDSRVAGIVILSGISRGG